MESSTNLGLTNQGYENQLRFGEIRPGRSKWDAENFPSTQKIEWYHTKSLWFICGSNEVQPICDWRDTSFLGLFGSFCGWPTLVSQDLLNILFLPGQYHIFAGQTTLSYCLKSHFAWFNSKLHFGKPARFHSFVASNCFFPPKSLEVGCFRTQSRLQALKLRAA